jgi:probable phosphoglycerate mutase
VTATVFLVRHAAHEHQGRIMVGRQDGVGLGPERERHLAWLRERFSRERLDAVWSSPIERARATAEAIAWTLRNSDTEASRPEPLEAGAFARRDVGGDGIILDEDLTELEFGEWTGLTFDELEADPRWPAWNESKATLSPPGGESILAMQARMVDAVDRIRRAHAGGAVAVVSHGDPIKGLLAYHLGMPVDRIDNFDVDHPSVSAIVVGDWGSKVLWINERYTPDPAGVEDDPPLEGEGDEEYDRA